MNEREDAYPRPVSDPEADGLPETADDDSNAFDETGSERTADGPDPYPLPGDREDSPAGMDDYGTGGGDGLRGESIWRRLRREEPDFSADGVPLDPDARLAEEADPDALGQVEDDSMSLVQDDAVPPELDSETSVFDRPVSGVPLTGRVGRLVQPDEGAYGDEDGDEFATDAGIAGGGESAEEAAVHLIRPDNRDGEEEPDDDARYDASL
jgi:Family of unknown function (DUF5709)